MIIIKDSFKFLSTSNNGMGPLHSERHLLLDIIKAITSGPSYVVCFIIIIITVIILLMILLL